MRIIRAIAAILCLLGLIYFLILAWTYYKQGYYWFTANLIIITGLLYYITLGVLIYKAVCYAKEYWLTWSGLIGSILSFALVWFTLQKCIVGIS